MSDPLESASKGFVEGILEWSSEKIPEIVRRFRDGELAFVKDRNNIDLVRAQKESAEYKLLSPYVAKGKLSILLQMGLALRQIENDPEKLEDLRQKIYGKFGTTELRIAELVKIGIVTQLLTYLVKIFRNPKDVESRLTSFLNQVDDLALFIKKDDLVEGKANLVMLRVDANPAHMAIIFGTGNAKPVVLKILRRIKGNPRNFLIEIQEEGNQITAFVFSPETRERLAHWAVPLTGEEATSKR